MKDLTGVLLSAALALLGAGGALAADTNPLNDSDSLTITITPATDLGVDVDTTTTRFSAADTPGTMSLSLALGATAYFVSPATVTILGNFNNQEVELKAQALDQWTVDADDVVNETNAAQLYALFAQDKDAHPDEAEFQQGDDGRHMVRTAPAVAGEPDGAEDDTLAANTYEINNGDMPNGADMDNLPVNTVRQLWLRLDAPTFSDWSGVQRFVVTLTAVTGVTN
ncbi:MAG: hypothetical protein WC969_02580 [Elusimicrobiota bacterium]|jgi:hypothetical protein